MPPEEPEHTPPNRPPPLLTLTQIERLILQGHLPIRLPSSLTDSLRALQDAQLEFFAQPDSIKSLLYPAGNGTELGYYNIPLEKEYLTLRHLPAAVSQNHAQAQTLEYFIAEVWHCVSVLLLRVLADVSAALGIPFDAWTAHLPSTAPPSQLDASEPTLLRLFRYERGEGTAAPHTDNGLLTLCVGGGRGLQVWQDLGTKPDRNAGVQGEWCDAEGPTVLVGDVLRVLSSNRARAGRHRVIGTENGRSSIVFAMRPTLGGVVDLTMFGGEGAVAMRDLWHRITAKKINVNAQKELREEQKRRLGKRKTAEAGMQGMG